MFTVVDPFLLLLLVSLRCLDVYHSDSHGCFGIAAATRRRCRGLQMIGWRRRTQMILAVDILQVLLPSDLLVQTFAPAADDLSEGQPKFSIELGIDQRVQHRRRVAKPEKNRAEPIGHVQRSLFSCQPGDIDV